MRRIAILAFLAVVALALPATAYDGIVEKKSFALPSYTTVGGKTIKDVKIGWESYGTLNADKSNAILIAHFFSATSHAAGKYDAKDAAPGYWDKVIGAGLPFDTDKYFVISADTLVNLNVKDPRVVTTGPSSIDPATGKPYGLSFPIVTIRDFVNVQKALLDSLGIRKLHTVAGASMGALQAFEWAAAYPDMVERIVPVIGSAELDAYAIGGLHMWAAPIMLDPRWNGGDYYGKDEPVQGLGLSLALVTLDARHPGWADKTFGRKWAAEGKDPLASFDNKFAIADTLEKTGLARARTADANSFLYLVRANQLFSAGHKGSLEEGLKGIKAKTLLLPAASDLLLFPAMSERAMRILKLQGTPVDYQEIPGDGGHLDGVLAIDKVGEAIRRFLGS